MRLFVYLTKTRKTSTFRRKLNLREIIFQLIFYYSNNFRQRRTKLCVTSIRTFACATAAAKATSATTRWSCRLSEKVIFLSFLNEKSSSTRFLIINYNNDITSGQTTVCFFFSISLFPNNLLG